MTFLEAIAIGRPMRRKSSLGTPPWLALGIEKRMGGDVPRWREVSTGEPVGLWKWDYEAADWEVLP